MMEKTVIKSKQGFTLIELSLVMIFVAMLVISIVVVTNNIVTIYQKGLTINAVSETGKEIVNDINSSVSEAPKEDFHDLCEKQFANGCNENDYFEILVYHQNTDDKTGLPTNGVFCTGRYSYVWNTGYVLRDEEKNKSLLATVNGAVPHLAKVYDPLHKICFAANHDRSNSFSSDGEVTDLLVDVDPHLALFNLTVFKPATEINIDNPDYRLYYAGSFLLSSELKKDDTTQVTLDKKSVDGNINCRQDNQKDNAYCAINKFNFASWAMGG